jgi:hypothetical protein
MKQPFTPATRPVGRVVSPVWQYPLAWLLVLLLSFGLAPVARAQTSITSFAPTGGPVGSTVIITGGPYINPVYVSIGGVSVTSGSYTSTQITCIVPAGATTGPIVVTSNGGVATSATNFVVTTAGQYLMNNDPLTACSGTLYDSGGPTDPYSNSETYVKTLTPSTAGAKMRMTFTSFDLESNYDFLSIYDGPSTASTLIGTYTGANSPGTVTATNATGQLTVVFTSDVSQTPSGFEAAISCVTTNVFLMNNTPVTTCSGTFYDSGGAGSSYTNNENFTKVFTPATAGAKMRMTFTSFDLESNYDFLSIYDGPSTGSTLIGTYTGANSPGTVTATNATGQLTVVFTSDVSQTPSGWEATLSCTAVPSFSVTSRNPVANVVSAPLASSIAVGFSATPTAASANTIRVYGNLGRGLRTMSAATVSGTTATLAQTSPVFLPGETVSVSVPSTVLSTTGAVAVPYVYQFTTATTASSGRFGAPVAYATGTSPGDMVMGDITGDNRPDIVVANTADNTISVFPGSSTGVFGARADYAANAGPLGIVLGDVNGDGRLDVVVANSTTTSVSVLLNTGAGLGFPAEYPCSNVPGLVAVGDVNGDGRLDIIVSNAGNVNAGFGSTVSVYLNLGSGIFGTRTDYTTGLNPNGVAVGDVNNDGKLDIVTSNLSANTASVLLGNGNGSFATKVDYATASTPFYVALNDLNADGRLDIVTGNNSVNGVSVLLSAAPTGSSYLTHTDYNTGTTPQDVDLADVNGDGRFDIITANQGTNNASVLLGTGTGSFGPKTDYATGLGTASTALADVNGDGRLDLAAMNSGANTVSVLLGVPTPTITSFTPASGAAGTSVTITGTNFTGATTLTLNGVPVTSFTVVNSTTITFTVPSGASTGLLAVTTPGGTATSATNFTVTVAAQLVVTQGGFPYPSNGTAYNFGNQTVSTTSAPATFILANPGAAALTLTGVSTTGNFAVSGTAPTTVPAGGTASVSVTFSPTTVGAQLGTLRLVSGLGTYVVNLSGTGVYAVPTIGAISPASGPVGTVVTVTGTGFVSGGTTVTINGVTITGVTVGAGGTTLTFTIPTGATSGPVVVTTPGGTITGATPYCVQYTPTTATTPASRCGAGSLTLTAGGAPTGGTYAWYTQQTGGTAIAGATTASYTTPSLSATTTYYVAITTGSGAAACEGPRTAVTAVINTIPVVTITAATSTTFCAGGSVVLTASGANSYQWSNGATTASITVNASGSYAVTGTTTAGCSATSAATTVTVTPLPAAPATTPASRCDAGTLTLTASGAPSGGTYAWYTQQTGGTPVVVTLTTNYTTPVLTATTTYYVSILTSGGCEGPRAAVVATINPLPTVSIAAGGPTSFCAGGSVVLTASGASTYQWSTGATTASITVSTAGSYTVTGATTAGCLATSVATTVTVNPLPTAPTVTPAASCGAGSLTLTASGAPAGGSYAWYTQQTGGTAISGATTASYTTPSLSATTTYYVSMLTSGGCEGPRTAVVATINPVPTVSITAAGPTSFCQGGSVMLTASGADTYLWSNGATTASITVTAGGSYTVTGTTAAGCSAASAATTVTVNPLPTIAVTAAGPTTFCAGGSVVLTASGASSYQWSTGATTASITVSASGSYSVTGTSASGCQATSAATTVTVTPAPAAPATTPAALCMAGSLTLTASGAPAGGSYAWYTQATGGTAISGATGSSYTTPNLTATTTYYVSIIGAGGCESPRTPVTATISALPVVTVTTSGPTTFCQGGDVTLTATGANTYLWSTGATTASITVSAGGTYTVTGTVAAGCVAAPVATTVTVNPTPTAPTAPPAANCGPGSVTLTASGAPAGGTYAWYTQLTGGTAISGATAASYTTPSLSATTTYYVSAMNASGCESPRTPVTATINALPTVSIATGGPTSFCQGGSVVLTASGADTYLWSNGATTPSITVTAGGSYTVTGTTTTGCSATSAATAVTVEPLPATPVITQSPAGTLTSSAATGNQWYIGGSLIPGATGQTYVVTSAAQNGSYTVVTTSATGCASATSAAVTVTVTGTASAALTAAVLVYPNPAHSACTVQVPAIAGASKVELTLLNALGQMVQQRVLALPASGTRAELDLQHVASGVYLVRLQAGPTTVYKRLTID